MGRFIFFLCIIFHEFAEASDNNPVYLDCSEVISDSRSFSTERHDYVRVFRGIAMEILDFEWKWYRSKAVPNVGSYYSGDAIGTFVLARDTLKLEIWDSVGKQRLSQCRPIADTSFEALRRAALARIEKEKAEQERKNLL